MLEGNPELMREIEEKVRAMSEKAGLATEQEFEVDDEDDDFDLNLSSLGADGDD